MTLDINGKSPIVFFLKKKLFTSPVHIIADDYRKKINTRKKIILKKLILILNYKKNNHSCIRFVVIAEATL